MRISFVLPYANLSGGIRIIAGYAERLQQRGWDVTAVSTPRPRQSLKRRVRNWLAGKRLPKNEPSHLDSTAVRHIRLAEDRPIVDADLCDGDAVVATWWRTAEWVADMQPSKGAKVHLIQGLETWGGPPERVRAVWRLPMQKIVVSEWLGGIARNEFDDPQVRVVPNAIDHNVYRAPPREKNDTMTIGFVYSPDSIKGCDIIARAIEIVRRRLQRVRIIAFGRIASCAPMPLPADTAFHQLPPQPQIPSLYAACDVWLFGSRNEGFGLPILEAMACRTPVVATPAGAAPELLSAGGGCLVAMDDAQAMADAVLDIAAMDLPAWRAMSDAAQRTAANYTWARATDQFEAAIAQAIERTQRGEL